MYPNLAALAIKLPYSHSSSYVSSKLPLPNIKTSKNKAKQKQINSHQVHCRVHWISACKSGYQLVRMVMDHGRSGQPSFVIRSQEPAVVKYLRNQSSKLWRDPGPFLRLIPIRRDYLVCFDCWFIFGGFCRECLQSVGWNFGGKATRRCAVSLDPVDFHVGGNGWIILDQICTRESVSVMYIPWLKWGG